MKIIIVGASGTMGKHLSAAFEKENEVIRAATTEGDLIVDITSPASIEKMYKDAGPFDALICTAGPTFVGPWKKMTDTAFRKGLEGKLMGQINLVLIGQHYINPKDLLH
jgi:dTDP-4-dehydrorhamnose reductase